MNMAFGVRQVRDFLKRNGCVLTVRGYDYQTMIATVPELDGIRIKRKKVCEITTIDDLDGFVPLSGFKTASEWWIQIKRFCKGRMWLYRVQIDDTGLSQQEQDYEKIEQQRMFIDMVKDDIKEFEHPYDIRNDPGMNDPALVDLQPHRDAAHSERIQREAQQADRRIERMREQAGQGKTMRFIPDPAIVEKRAVQEVLAGFATAAEALKEDEIQAHIDDLIYDILDETDIDAKMLLLEDIEHARRFL